MTTPELLRLIRLLSGLESVLLMQGARLPDYLHVELTEVMEVLEREVIAAAQKQDATTGHG
jgi:hypothetical protein